MRPNSLRDSFLAQNSVGLEESHPLCEVDGDFIMLVRPCISTYAFLHSLIPSGSKQQAGVDNLTSSWGAFSFHDKKFWNLLSRNMQ